MKCSASHEVDTAASCLCTRKRPPGVPSVAWCLLGSRFWKVVSTGCVTHTGTTSLDKLACKSGGLQCRVLLVCATVQNADAAGFVTIIGQLVDDLAALLAGSALQLLGGACVSPATASMALQASRLTTCWRVGYSKTSLKRGCHGRGVGGLRCEGEEDLFSSYEITRPLRCKATG